MNFHKCKGSLDTTNETDLPPALYNNCAYKYCIVYSQLHEQSTIHFYLEQAQLFQ